MLCLRVICYTLHGLQQKTIVLCMILSDAWGIMHAVQTKMHQGIPMQVAKRKQGHKGPLYQPY